MSKLDTDPKADKKSRVAHWCDAVLFVLLLVPVSLGLWVGYGEFYFKVRPVITGSLMLLMGVFSCLALHALCQPRKRSVGWVFVALFLCVCLFVIRGMVAGHAEEKAGDAPGTFLKLSVNNGQPGIDVWVNDVCLGEVPLEISRSRFEAMVHPWAQEPNENSYFKPIRYNYQSPGGGSSTVARWRALPKAWPGYYVRFTRGRFGGYCRNAGQSESHSGRRHETNLRFSVEFPGREAYIRQLLNKARAMDYDVDNTWMEALDELGKDAQDILFRAAYFDALGQGGAWHLDVGKLSVSEPGMVTLMETWLAWKYGWSSTMDSGLAFGILVQMIKDVERYEQNRQAGFIVWAVGRLVPYLDAQQVVDWMLPSLWSRRFDQYAETYWPTRLAYGLSFSGDSFRQRTYLQLETLFQLDRCLDRQHDGVNPVEAVVVPEIIARFHGTAHLPALRIALLLGHPDLERYLSNSWRRSQQRHSQTPQANGVFSQAEEVDLWLFLLAHLQGEPGHRFRAQYAESILDMTKRLFAEKPDIWDFYSLLTFTDVERMEGKDSISSRVFSMLAESMGNGTSSGNNPQLLLWDQILRTEPLCPPELYVRCWRFLKTPSHGFYEVLSKLIALPPAKRQIVLEALIQEMESNADQILSHDGQTPDVTEAKAVLQSAEAMLKKLPPQGQADHFMERLDYLSDFQLRWLMEQRPGSKAADSYATSPNAGTRLKAVTLYSAHATAYAREQLARLLEDEDNSVREAAQTALNELKILAEQRIEALLAQVFDPPASGRRLVVRQYESLMSPSYRNIDMPVDVIWELRPTPWAQDQWCASQGAFSWASRDTGFGNQQKHPLVHLLSGLPDNGIYVIDPNDQMPEVRDSLNETCFVWNGSFAQDRLDTRSSNREDAVIEDFDGEPISGAEIMIRCKHKDNGSVLWIGGHVTDAQGRIPVSTVKGDYTSDAMKVSHPDYGSTTRALGLRGMSGARLNRIDSLAHSRMFYGQVLDANQVPVDGAAIRITALKRATDSSPHNAGQYVKIPTDAQGRFRFLPSGQNIPVIPPVAEYRLEVTPPEGRAMLPHVGLYPNGREIVIQMTSAKTKYVFRFEDAEAQVIDSRTIRPLRLVLRNAKGERLIYSEDQVQDGIFLPPGTLSAGDSFDPVVVSKESPEVIVFRKKQPRLLRGRVLDAVTEKPISNVLIVNYHGRKNDAAASEFTDEDWDAMDQWTLSDSTHPGWDLVDRLVAEFTVSRTDEQGGFSMTVPPTSTYFMVALGRAHVPHQFRTQDTKIDDQRTYGFENIYLVPSARLVFDIEGPDRRQTFYAELLVDRDEAPEWWQTREDLSLRYPADVRSGSRQAVLVAASVPFGLQIRTSRGPWSSIDLPDQYLLAPGQVLDLGRLKPEPAVQVSVRVVDREGNAVEGMRITVTYDKPSYGVGQTRTDPDGRSTFYINAHSQGTFSAFPNYDRASEASSIRFKADDVKEQGSDITILLDE